MTVDLDALARDLAVWQKTINTEWLDTFRRDGHITGEYEALFALGLTLTGAAGQARAIQLTRYENARRPLLEPPAAVTQPARDTAKQGPWRHQAGLTT